MSNLLKSKFLFGVVAFATVAIVAGVLMMTAATSASAAYMHTTLLKQGSTGAQVMELQKTLNMTTCKVAVSGAGSPGMETSTFGGLTKAAVMCFQAANGLTVDGVVGAMTGGKLAMVTGTTSGNLPTGCTSTAGYSPITGTKCDSGTGSGLPAGCTSTAGYSPTTGMPCSGGSTGGDDTLEGGAGSVDSYSLISGLNDEEVGEGEEDVVVAGLEIETDDGSDLEFTAVKLDFADAAESADASVTADQDFEDYASEVSIWLDGEEVARVDADEFDEDGDWDKTISLDGAVCDAGETCELTVAVSGIANLDSNDDGEPWGLDFAQVRFMDADGTVISEDPAVAETPFSFELFATAANTELSITPGADDDEVNEAHIIDVHATDETENVELLSFNMEVEGDSDIVIDSLPVSITVGGAQDNVDEMISELTLWMDGEEVGSASIGSDCGTDADCSAVGATEDYNFTDLDLTLEAGDDYEFLVKAGIYGITDTGDVAAGDTILAVFGETQTDDADFDAEDEAGEDLVDGDITGTVTGEASTVYDIAFTFDLVSVDAEVTSQADPATMGSTDRGLFTIVYDLTAFGGDVSIDQSCIEDQADAADQGTEYGIETEASDSCTVTSTADVNGADADAWVVEEDQTERFTLSVTATAADAFVHAWLASINWDDDTTDTSPDLFFTAGLGEDNTQTTSLFLETI